MMGHSRAWAYDLYVCESDSRKPEEHGDSCTSWRHGGTWLDHEFRAAYQEAARQSHAYVETTSPHNGAKAIGFKHLDGGGLCELCGPTTGRRGPWTRTPSNRQFLCDVCGRDLQQALDDLHKSIGAYRSRDVRPVLEDAE
ncbi:hypothetical protein [Streptomyces sp. CC210A]|uniref:hypothetical protein n=1 Tax=Streptomyces sp. CC210A TaxID=2898184 RepID=UPI001F35A15C|nr:hypothetical protein [Streptomyces sp. CC210A]